MFSVCINNHSRYIRETKLISIELDDPLIESVLIHMYLHPGGTDIEELVGSEHADEVLECFVRNGMIERFP